MSPNLLIYVLIVGPMIFVLISLYLIRILTSSWDAWDVSLYETGDGKFVLEQFKTDGWFKISEHDNEKSALVAKEELLKKIDHKRKSKTVKRYL